MSPVVMLRNAQRAAIRSYGVIARSRNGCSECNKSGRMGRDSRHSKRGSPTRRSFGRFRSVAAIADAIRWAEEIMWEIDSRDARYVFDIADERHRTKADDDATSSLEGQLGWSVNVVKTFQSSDRDHKYQLAISNSTKGSEVT
jgi:hypothetical protein